MPKRKDKAIITRVDEELYDQAHGYARDHGISLGALIRWLLRIQTDTEDPRELPPEAYREGAKAEPGPYRRRKR